MKYFIKCIIKCNSNLLLNIMKLSVCLSFLLCFSLLATPSYAQHTKINLEAKTETVKSVLKMIEEQSNFRFFYNSDIIDLDKTVNISLSNKNIEEVLNAVFAGTMVGFRVMDNNFVVLSSLEMLQQSAITGTVTDATGETLPGVNVVIKGSNVGVVTNVSGQFSINVPDKAAVLVFSSVGFATQEITVGDQRQITVTLAEAATSIEEVVVIGYGTQRKEAVTGSVASIGGDVMREVPSANISQALQGRVAGVDMTQTSSKPGAEMQIRIRGMRSLNASNDPLIVLDGIPFAGSIGDINPNDIKTLDILKDASATAIYGSRGANGVILISTNRGYVEQKATVSYNGYYGVKTVFAPYPMMDGPSFVKLRQAAGRYNNSLDESDDVNTDWQELLYRTGMVTSHDIGVSGGSTKGSYNFGTGYYKDEAVLPGQDYNRFSLRAAIDQEVGIFRFGLTSNNNYSITNGSNLGVYNTLSASPIVDPWNADGTWKTRFNMPLDNNNFAYSKEVIEGLGNSWIDQSKTFGSYNMLYGEVKIPGVEGLKFRTNLGLNFRMSNGGSYTGEGIFNSSATNPSSASVSNTLTTNWASENMLTYDRIFADKHQINVIGMYSAEQTHYNRSYMAARDIPADQFQYYNLGRADGEITVNPSEQDYRLSGLMSWMGRVMYSYDSRYMISATLRSDASSRLAPGHQRHTYPAISAGWNIKKESFMDNVDIVDALKFRVGYGQTSNQSIDPYATLGLLNTRPYNFGGTYATGYYVSSLPNPNLGWEYSETWNFGLDFSLLNNRLSGTLEYYSQSTKDVLLNVNLPSSSGVTSYMANIGETENKGFEMSLNGVILDNYNGWSWDAGVNFYVNRNKLVSLASGQERDETNWWFVGHPIDVIYDYEKIGIWQDTDPHLAVLEPGGNVGMIKVQYNGEYDANGVPTRRIGTADRIPIDVEPNFQGGFNTRLAYKGIDLSIVGAFKSGGKLISTLYTRSGYLNMLSGRRGNVEVDYWMPDNTGAKYPFPGGLVDGDAPKYGSTLGYFDASYLKIRTITLGYNFTPKLTKKVGVDRLRVYFTVQNPFVLFSPYHDESGMDPETNSYGNQNQAVESAYQSRLLVIGTNSPATRNYLFGLNLTF
jgi:TonB-linked SusC/RagA family outer membrane protein